MPDGQGIPFGLCKGGSNPDLIIIDRSSHFYFNSSVVPDNQNNSDIRKGQPAPLGQDTICLSPYYMPCTSKRSIHALHMFVISQAHLSPGLISSEGELLSTYF